MADKTPLSPIYLVKHPVRHGEGKSKPKRYARGTQLTHEQLGDETAATLLQTGHIELATAPVVVIDKVSA